MWQHTLYELERHRKGVVLSYCSGCQARLYCSDRCMKADWIVHRNECSGGTRSVESSQLTRTSSDANGEIQPPQEEEYVILHGLQAKQELNGRVGVVRGALNADSRYPVQLEGKPSMIAVKPGNIYQFGVFVTTMRGKAREFMCAAHRQELCDTCSLDTSVINHLFKLQRYKQSLTRQKIEEIAELNFARLKTEEWEGILDRDYPVECAGLSENDKARFILKSLLKYVEDKELNGETVPLMISVAINALCCYSAIKQPVVRPYAMEQLTKLSF